MTSTKPHRGTMVLIFGILGFCCVIFGILAWVFGSTDLKEMEAGRMDPSGRSLTNTGMILGIVSVAWNVIALILQFVLGVGLAASGAG